MTKHICLTFLSIICLCSCGVTALTKSTTTITDNRGTLAKSDDRVVTITGKPDSKIKYAEKKGGLLDIEVDNRGKQGFTEKLGDAAIDALRDTDLYVGAGGTAKGSDD